MHGRRAKAVACAAALAALCAMRSAGAFSQEFPRIEELSSRNTLFKQYQEDVQSAGKEHYAGRSPLTYFQIYTYTAQPGDTLARIASRCSVSQDTIATANSLEGITDDLAGTELLLPTVRGLFIPVEPQSSMEILLFEQHRATLDGEAANVATITLRGRQYNFIYGYGAEAQFSPTERLFFLDGKFRLPLEKSVLTSDWGMRVSPISGQWKMHNGIDMAAPLGTPVFACKRGTVTQVLKNDAVYGNCITIRHDGGLTSVYAHLSDVLVTKGATVGSGQQIGKVGITGMTTGPHLHFEIREAGSSVSPYSYIPDLPK